MTSPPNTQMLSTCFWIVFGFRFADATRYSRKGRKQATSFSPGRHVFFQSHPRARPIVQAPAVTLQGRGGRRGGAVYPGSSHRRCLLRHVATHHDSKPLPSFPGLCLSACLLQLPITKALKSRVRPRKGSAAVCSRCHQPAPGYDQLAERRYEFIPFWGFLVFLLYSMRRVDCRRCQAVVVEEVPWGNGKHQLTNAYMLFLARWARRLSWKETAEAFRTSWDKVCDAVEHVVTFGLEHRTLGQIDAIGVDEIQYAKGHKYLTLVYQIDLGVTRLLWVGKERTIESFQGFFTTIGEEITSKIVFVCSDMWEPYLKVIREKCSEALHILDRFHIVAKMNKALDEVRAGESRRMASEGRTPATEEVALAPAQTRRESQDRTALPPPRPAPL